MRKLNPFFAFSVTLLLLSSCSDPKTPPPSPKPPVVLRLEIPTIVPPAHTAKNQLLAHTFRQSMSSAHASCGLKAVEFQESIDRLQKLSAGTDFQDLAVAFVTAARLCHDAQIKPTKYVSMKSESETLANGLKVTPQLDVTTYGPVTTITLKGGVEHTTSKDRRNDVMEAVEFAPEILVSPETLKNLHQMEDSVYIEVLKALQRFPMFKRSDIAGKKLSWKWGDEGRIEFSLSSNGTMEARLYPVTNDILYKLSDWGDGDWDLDGDRLVITMRRVGKRGVPFFTKQHRVQWIDQRIEHLTEDRLLLENGEVLHVISSE